MTQVSSGNAPAGLQSAFDKLMTDVKAFGAGRTATPGDGSSAGSSGTDAATPTLQQVLGALQQRLGYGSGAGGSSAVGNTVDLTA